MSLNVFKKTAPLLFNFCARNVFMYVVLDQADSAAFLRIHFLSSLSLSSRISFLFESEKVFENCSMYPQFPQTRVSTVNKAELAYT